MNGDPLSIAQIAFAALGDIALAVALGALLLDAWLRREQAFAPLSPARHGWQRARRTFLLAALALAVCNFVSLWLQAAAMNGGPIADAGASLWLVATATHAGIGWSVALVVGVLLFFSSMTSTPFAFALLAAIVAAAGKSAIGHAADAGAFSIAEIVQTVHLLATGVWGGVVIAGGVAVLPALDTSTARANLIRIVGKMSRAAMIAIALVFATGVFNAWRGMGGIGGIGATPSVLTMSTWGHALLLKLALVVAALVFGALNRWSALPRLRRTASTADAHTVINVMRIEALAMLGVFVAAALLSHSVPGMAGM